MVDDFPATAPDVAADPGIVQVVRERG